jgi:virginiamycin B lyase
VVKDASGAPMPSVVVRAKNTDGITVSVLSQRDGTYKVDDLRPGTYTVTLRRQSYTTEPQTVRVATSPTPNINFTMSRMPNGTADKTQLSNFDLHTTLPPSKFKDIMMGTRERAATGCEICHSFTGLAARPGRKNLAFWRDGLKLMVDKNYSDIAPEDMEPFAQYLHAAFGDGATWQPKLEPDPVEGLGLNIRYVTYDLPARNAMPHTAIPDGQGNVFVAEFGGENIGWLNVTTGEVDEFEFPYHFVTRPHGVAIDNDGNAWITQQGSGYIAMFDVKTKRFSEYKIPASEYRAPDFKPFTNEAGYVQPDAAPHSITIDVDNNPWVTGGAAGTRKTLLRKLDRKTNKWTEVVIKDEQPGGRGGLYGVVSDPKTGNVWWAGIGINEVGYVDPKTNKVTRFAMLSPNSGPRRLKLDSKGIAWVNQTNTNKLARIDPKTGTVTEYDIPGGDQALHPYPTGIDHKDRIWTQTYRDDRLHMFDPATEKFTTFLMPDKGNGLRDFFLDKNGVMWAGVFGRDQIIGFKLIE